MGHGPGSTAGTAALSGIPGLAPELAFLGLIREMETHDAGPGGAEEDSGCLRVGNLVREAGVQGSKRLSIFPSATAVIPGHQMARISWRWKGQATNQLPLS